MKSKNIKWIGYALASLILMQSCVVYQKTPASVDEAVATNKNAKILTTENETYKFKQLVKEEGNLYGITGSPKHTKQLKPYITETVKHRGHIRYKILLPFDIKEVYPKDKRGSTIATLSAIFLPVAIIIAAVTSGFSNFNIGP